MTSLTAGAEGAVVELDAGRLTALVNPYPVDGRVSWHARDARGYAPMTCYLLLEEQEALLVDTGLTIHERSVLAQLDETAGTERALSVLLLRQGEFDSMCNLAPIVERFGVRVIHGQYADAPDWADFRAEYALESAPATAAIKQVETRVPRSTDRLTFGDGRTLDLFVPALRLLGTYWAYDGATRTLFTSDSFSYGVAPDAAGPWLITSANDEITPDEVERHLLDGRYWWLPGAQVDGLRRHLADVFERHEVARIAPGFGAILEGPEVVARHYAMVDGIIARLGRTG